MTKEEAIKTIISLAEEQVGYAATPVKRNKYAEELDDVGFFNGKKNGYDWCCCFVAWLFESTWGKETAQKMLYLPEKSLGAACPYAADYYITDGGAWHAVPAVGDQIFFGDRGDEDHTGIVVAAQDGRVYTIEGNAGGGNGKVLRREYDEQDGWISGYGRPNWSVVSSDTTAPEPQPEPTPEPQKEPILEEDGDFGRLSVTAMQWWLGTIADGEISGQIEWCRRYYPAITAVSFEQDGSPMVAAFQSYLERRGFDPYGVDGIIGENTVRAWQRWLRDQQWFRSLSVDGIFGPASAKAMQHFLNVVLAT